MKLPRFPLTTVHYVALKQCQGICGRKLKPQRGNGTFLLSVSAFPKLHRLTPPDNFAVKCAQTLKLSFIHLYAFIHFSMPPLILGLGENVCFVKKFIESIRSFHALGVPLESPCSIYSLNKESPLLCSFTNVVLHGNNQQVSLILGVLLMTVGHK